MYNQRGIIYICVYLSSKIGSATLGHLEDDRGFGIAGSLEGSDNGGGGCAVLKMLADINWED